VIDLDHLSYSSISLYLRCSRAWYGRYVDHIKVPTSPALVFGSAIHNTIERYLLTGQDPLSAWSECWAEQVNSEGSGIEWGGDTPERFVNDGIHYLGSKAVQDGIAALKCAMGANGPRVEERVTLTVPGVPLPLIGYIDFVAPDGVPCDLKTAARAWDADKAQREPQSLYYLAALNQSGETVPQWMFRHYVLVKTKKPQWQVFEHRHSVAELFGLLDTVQQAWRGIEAGIFTPNTSGWQCSPKYCDMWQACQGK
jgi:hypothetical protein